jgi:hypothetical protein
MPVIKVLQNKSCSGKEILNFYAMTHQQCTKKEWQNKQVYISKVKYYIFMTICRL